MYTVDYASKEQMLNKYKTSYELPQLLNEKKEIEKILKEEFKDILKHNWSFDEVIAKPSFVKLNKFNYWWDLYREVIVLIVLKQNQ